MGLPDYIVHQLAKPTGLLGWFILWRLNRANRSMNAVTLAALALRKDDRVLEIGFGGGELLKDIVHRKPQSVAGIEISELAISKARTRFRQALADEALMLALFDGGELPFESGAFSKACCVNVVYFWDEPTAMMSETCRVLQSGGQFVVCYEPVGPNERKMPPDQIERWLTDAGFGDIATLRDWNRVNADFFCTTARKQ